MALLLHGTGAELHLVTLDPTVARTTVLHGPRLRLSICPMRDRHRARDAFRAERRAIRAALDAWEADVVHARWTYEYALAALGRRTPAIVTLQDWGPTVSRHDRSPYRLVRLGMQLVVLRRASWVLAVSPHLRARARHLAKADITVVPNALPAGWPRAQPEPRAPGRPAHLVAVAEGFGRLKNVGRLLEALAVLRQTRPDTTLELVGDGHEAGGPAHRWARDRGLAAGVTFRGHVDRSRLPAIVGQADVFVHPSREEGFGMVLIEAMALGVPVVGGARAGAVPWVLDEGRAGVLTDVGDAGAIAATLDGLLADDEARQRVGRAGRARVDALFAGEQVRDELLRFYERVRTESSA
jgi:glycosyltransferase involved in cell wall biosynthesis